MVSSVAKNIELVENKVDDQKGELVTNFVPLKDDAVDERSDPTSVKPFLDENNREAASDVKGNEAEVAGMATVDVNEEIAYAKHLTEDGPLFFKIPAFIGGLAMIFSSVVDFFFGT